MRVHRLAHFLCRERADDVVALLGVAGGGERVDHSTRNKE